MNDPIVKRRRRANRPTKVQAKLIKDQVQMNLDSPEFEEFIKTIENTKDPQYGVCLTCW